MSDTSTPQPLYRLLRVLEYTDTREFIDKHLTNRYIKGELDTSHIKGGGQITEYYFTDDTLGKDPVVLGEDGLIIETRIEGDGN
jgi:hypothetical protein